MGDAAREMLAGLLQAARTSVPDEVAALLADRGQPLGAWAVTVYLVDHEQYVLVPLPQHADGNPEPLSIEASLAGGASGTSSCKTPTRAGGRGCRCWTAWSCSASWSWSSRTRRSAPRTSSCTRSPH